MARDIVTLEISVKPWKVGKGHKAHRGGAGGMFLVGLVLLAGVCWLADKLGWWK